MGRPPQLLFDRARLPFLAGLRTYCGLPTDLARGPGGACAVPGAHAAWWDQADGPLLPFPVLHPRRLRRLRRSPGLAPHARPERQPLAFRDVVVPPVQPVPDGRSCPPARHLRRDRVLDRRRQLGRGDERGAQQHLRRSDRRGPGRWGQRLAARPARQATSHQEVGRLHGHPRLRGGDAALRRAPDAQHGQRGFCQCHVVAQPAGLLLRLHGGQFQLRRRHLGRPLGPRAHGRRTVRFRLEALRDRQCSRRYVPGRRPALPMARRVPALHWWLPAARHTGTPGSGRPGAPGHGWRG